MSKRVWLDWPDDVGEWVERFVGPRGAPMLFVVYVDRFILGQPITIRLFASGRHVSQYAGSEFCKLDLSSYYP